MTRHERFHTQVYPYKCDDCDMSYSAARNFNQHNRTNTGTRAYLCSDCDKSFFERTVESDTNKFVLVFVSTNVTISKRHLKKIAI